MTMLVEVLVQAVTAQLLSAIEHQAQFCFNFKSELDQMKKWLDKMNGVLYDVDKKLSWDQKTIKMSLSDLREVIYEADNALTDCLIREIEETKKWFCSCSLPLNPFFKHKMGRRLTKINFDMKDVHDKLARYLKLSAAVSNPSNSRSQKIISSTQGLASPYFCPRETETYGLKGDIEKLKAWILNGDEREPNAMNYIGIVGMGGLGKTTLAQNLMKEISHHFDEKIWVCVSGNFNEQYIMMQMLENVCGGTTPSVTGKKRKKKKKKKEKGTTPSNGNDMLNRLIKVLEGKSYLIVLDNVWPYEKNPNWLKDLCSRLPESVGKSSWTIITTRNEDVAKNMVLRDTLIHKPNPLNDDDSWGLFSDHAFQKSKKDYRNDKDRKHDSEHILKKCGGLPLAIRTLGRILSQKVDSPAGWKDISNKFHELTTGGKTEPVYSSLRLSYDELPSASLKQCLLCVSIYPEKNS